MSGEAPDSNLRQLMEDLVTAVMDNYRCVPANQMAVQPSSLVVRHLPPGKPVDLYHLYRAVCAAKGDPVASPQWFRCIWVRKWVKVLRFRHCSTHAMCGECHRLKARIRHSKGMADHIEASTALLAHLQSQWKDRSVYWRHRALSREPNSKILCLIMDGMDRSKFALPRWYLGRAPKGPGEKINRPVLEVTATMVHGHGLWLWVTDEDTSIGSEWTCECVCRVLDQVWRRSQSLGRPWCDKLIVQSDNTAREGKNSHFQKLLCAFVASDLFSCATSQMLRVGHTHEDVDGVFGLIARCLREADEDMQTPEDVCAILRKNLARSWTSRGLCFDVQYINNVRPWKDVLPQVGLKDAYIPRQGAPVPHSFTFIKRECPRLDRTCGGPLVASKLFVCLVGFS